MLTTIRAQGKSLVVTIPKEQDERLGLEVGQMVDVAVTPVEMRGKLDAVGMHALQAALESSPNPFELLEAYDR